MSDVTGTCYVTMTDGTIGVPRTLSQIKAHPVTCYLFGGGKGDTRTLFNKSTNVGHTDIDISGGRIYGSVFGGGEDGHVMGNVSMAIQPGAKIGTWGTSYVEGNVFGGGRGFTGDAYTAGNVAGSITLNIKGGEMLGSVYGGGRLGAVGFGLYAPGEAGYGEMRDDDKMDDGKTPPAGWFPKGRGHIEVNISGGTIGNSREYKSYTFNVDKAGKTNAEIETAKNTAMTNMKTTNNIPNTEFEVVDSTKVGETTYTYTCRLSHTKGGNVFAGGMGRRNKLGGGVIDYPDINWWKLGSVKSTKLTISGNAWIMGNVYGGGEFSAVTGNHELTDGTKTGTEININGGTIGTEVTGSEPVKATIATPTYGSTDSPSGVKYTFGSVYGGGYGSEEEYDGLTKMEKILWNKDLALLGAQVADSTYIKMTTGLVRASVYGGGEIAAVYGSSHVNISGGKIGRDEVQGKNPANTDPGYVMFGGATMGNVYGGGKGTDRNPMTGVVRTNTNINISAGEGVPEGEPFIYHNVYGGGALASVGVFHPNNPDSDKDTDYQNNNPIYVPLGVPYGWTHWVEGIPTVSNTDGIAHITITGGTIGISGRDNGMVNGSSRGDVAVPEESSVFDDKVMKDPYDRFAYVNKSYVTIGTRNATTGPHIMGSVYGGGENGHNNNNANVTVYSGTIGVLEGDTWYDLGNTAQNEKAMTTRGNIYGAGCGTDTYTDPKDGKKKNNPWSGSVSGDTKVEIYGGLITHNVYGGGSLGSTGVITSDLDFTTNSDPTKSFALSWPCIFTYKPQYQGSNGNSTVNVYGGRIGTDGNDNGDIFGGARGIAGDAVLEIMHPGSVRQSTVNINFAPPSADKIAMVEEDGKYKLRIDLKDGSDNLVNAIAGSVYGGAEDGLVYENTYVTLTNGLIGHAIYGGGKGKGTYIPAGETKKVYSITAGKVYGNTNVTMNGGQVLRNIYGGGNLGSVGKGNYAFGSNDYSPHNAYGETLPEGSKLWPEGENAGNADFMNSGITTVNVTGGIVGFMPYDNTRILPMAGSETTFGSTSGDAELRRSIMTACAKDDLPTGNIFGGCRGEAAAESDLNNIRLGYVNESAVTIGDASTGPRIYGSVYGGGQDGHTRRSTRVTVNKGEIGIPYNDTYRAVMGTAGLSMEGELDNLQWLHRGNVYGGGSGIGMYKDGSNNEHNSSSAGSVNGTVEVIVNNGINGTAGATETAPGNAIYRNVYGGGSLASVCPFDGGVNAPYPFDVATPRGKKFYNDVTIFGTVGAASDYNEVYGGEVYGGSRGEKSVISDRPEWFSIAVWTRVKIMKGAHIMNNVFGGSDSGVVKKDSEVIVGEVE